MKDQDPKAKMTAKEFLAWQSSRKAGRSSPPKPGGRGHEGRGFREIGGRRIYFRSKAEANVARYLEWKVSRGELRAWDYEPKKFEFVGIKGKNYCYTPDFLITRIDGSVYWIEVKGWLDADSRIKLKRFAKYYPEETLEYWDAKRTKAIRDSLVGVLNGLE